MHSITKSDDLETLTDFLNGYEQHLNVRHLDAALDRVGRLSHAASEPSRSLSPRTAISPNRLQPSTPTATSRVLTVNRSNAKANVSAASAPGRRLTRPSPSSPTAADAQAAARAAAARLLSSILPAYATSLSPRDCAGILGSLARLELVPEPHLADLLQDRLLVQLPSSSVRDRAALLHASAKLRLGLPPGAVTEVLRSLDGGVLARSGKPQDVSMVLWALAHLSSSSSSPTMHAAASSGPFAAWLRRLLADLPPTRLAAFQPQALANTAWALASLGCRPDDAWLTGLVEASKPLLKVCFTQELCNLLWALAVMRFRPPATWLAEMTDRMREAAGSMTSQDVANVCWSLSVLGVRPGLGLIQRMVARALAVRRDMTPQGLVSTLWGLSRLRVQLPERAVALLLQGGLGAVALAGPGPGAGRDGAGAGEDGAEGDTREERLQLGRTRDDTGAEAGPVAGRASGTMAGQEAGVRQPTHTGTQSGLDGSADDRLSTGGTAPSGGRRLGASGSPGVGPGAGRGGVAGRGGSSGGGGVGDLSWTRHRPAGPGDLAGAALVLARCRHLPPRRWLARYFAAVARQLHCFGPTDIATLLYGLAGLAPLGLRAEPRWMDLVLAEVEEMAAAATATATAATATVTVTAAAPQAAVQAARATSSAQSLSGTSDRRGRSSLEARHLAVVLWSVGRLEHQPTEAWVEAMAGAVAARLEDFGPSEATTAIRAFQTLSAAAAARSRDTARSHLSRHHRSRHRSRPLSPAGSTNNCSSASVVAGLVARMAVTGRLPEHSLYRALQTVSQSTGGVAAYATVADQLMAEAYSVRSLALLGGQA